MRVLSGQLGQELDVICPYCAEGPLEPCRTASGRVSQYGHHARYQRAYEHRKNLYGVFVTRTNMDYRKPPKPLHVMWKNLFRAIWGNDWPPEAKVAYRIFRSR